MGRGDRLLLHAISRHVATGRRRIVGTVGRPPLSTSDRSALPKSADLGHSNSGRGTLRPIRPLPPSRPTCLERARAGANEVAGTLPHHLSPALPHLPASPLTHRTTPGPLPRGWEGLCTAHSPPQGGTAALACLPRHQLHDAVASHLLTQPAALQRPGHHTGSRPLRPLR